MMAMLKEFPEDYDFLPATYILPYEMNLFKAQFFEQVEKKEKEIINRIKKEAGQSEEEKKENIDQLDVSIFMGGE